MKYMSQSLPVNMFTVLEIEDINISDSEPKDIYFSVPANHPTLQRLKWERQLPKELSTNALNTCEMSLVLAMEPGMTNTSKHYSVNVLLDYRATGSFIDYDFICLKGINTQTISCPIPVFNVDGSPNKASQTLKVVDIVFYYLTYSEQILLAISSLGKQKLILGYTWLKDHNPKVNWEKGEVYMT